jgi:hypothetical protein
MATISQFYEVLSANIPVYIENALERAGSDLVADLKARAFPSTAGEGKDANGIALKQGRAYTPAYAKKRLENKLQAGYVDLQFTGNLLDNGIGENRGKEKYVIDFTNNRFAEIGRGLEDRYDQVIFAASTDEAEKAFDTFEFLFFGQVEKLSKEFGFR